MALRPINQTKLPELLAREPIKERNGASFTYQDANVTVARGDQRIALPLMWAFGAGVKGFTPVGKLGDTFIEHRVSWYTEPNKPSLTAGHPTNAGPDLNASLGIVQSPEMTSRCFGCHASGVETKGDLSKMRPGVTCERCHGPGSDHVKEGKPIFSPKKLASAKAKIGVCAQCHRSPNKEFASDMPEMDEPSSIRFAPVGFQVSKCFRAGKDFTCITCHDPHVDLMPASDSSYTRVCQTCHEQCKTGKREACVSCHMKASTPLPHLTFTDHRIRVYLD